MYCQHTYCRTALADLVAGLPIGNEEPQLPAETLPVVELWTSQAGTAAGSEASSSSSSRGASRCDYQTVACFVACFAVKDMSSLTCCGAKLERLLEEVLQILSGAQAVTLSTCPARPLPKH